MKNIIIRFIRIIVGRCPNCGEHLLCANNNDFEYGLWYCPNCDGELENDYIKDNKLVNSNDSDKVNKIRSNNDVSNKSSKVDNNVSDNEGVSEN